jgi:membrane associated rhomboid family serine protease
MASYNRDYMGGAAPPPGSSAGFTSPWRVYRILIVLNVLVYLLSKTSFGETFLLQHALVSLDALKAGRVWTLLLGGFFHLDAIHLLLTSGFVYVLGWRVEQERGPGVLLALYLLGSLTVGLASLAVNPSPGAPFGGGPEGPVSTGTGFLVAPGLALTNAHVVGTAETLKVQFEGEKEPVQARVRATDRDLDLALIELESDRKVVPAAIQRPPVGRAVFAYGYGTIQGDTTTQLMTSGRVAGFRNEKHWLVFDASVNPGNSGGPLVDSAGRWVAVVVAKTTPLSPGEDSRSFAIEGGAVQAWLATHGVQPEIKAEEPKLETPPEPGLGRSVMRLLVKGQPLPAPGKRHVSLALVLDPWIFGASGGFLALVGFIGLADPRRSLLVFGNPVPLLVIAGFGAVADMAGALRTYNNFHSWAHLYHLTALLFGMAFLKLYQGKLKGWLEARRKARVRAQLVVHKGGGRDEAHPNESKLSLADRARLDRVLEKVSRTGLDSLSEEERAFLDEASGKLRGE